MKVTIEQFQNGFARYIDNEFTSKLSGLSKWMTGMGGTSISMRLPALIKQYKPMLMLMGFVTDDGMIELDELYNVAIETARRIGPVVQYIPTLHDTTFTDKDIDKLKMAITQ